MPRRTTPSGRCNASHTTGVHPYHNTECHTCLPPPDITTDSPPCGRGFNRRVQWHPRGKVHCRSRGPHNCGQRRRSGARRKVVASPTPYRARRTMKPRHRRPDVGFECTHVRCRVHKRPGAQARRRAGAQPADSATLGAPRASHLGAQVIDGRGAHVAPTSVRRQARIHQTTSGRTAQVQALQATVARGGERPTCR